MLQSKVKILFFGLIMLFIISTSNAYFQDKIYQETECIDNTTININSTWLNENGTTQNVGVSQVCVFGCNEILNTCKPAPIFELTIAFLIILMVVTIIFKLVSRE